MSMAPVGRASSIICGISSILLLLGYVCLLVRACAFCRCFTWPSLVMGKLFKHFCIRCYFVWLICLGSAVYCTGFWHVAERNPVILTHQLIVFVFHHQVLIFSVVVLTRKSDNSLRKFTILTIFLHCCLYCAFAALLPLFAGRNDRLLLFRLLDTVALFLVTWLEYGQWNATAVKTLLILIRSQLALGYGGLLSGCGATRRPGKQLRPVVIVSSNNKRGLVVDASDILQ